MEPTTTLSSENFPGISFQIVYTGSALDNGAINATDFARAIIALQRLVEEISLQVNGSDYEVTLDLLRVEPGSSISTLLLKAKRLGKDIVKVGKSDEIDASNKLLSILKNTISITADLSAGLFFIISLIHSSPPPRVEEKGDTVNIYNTVNVHINNNTVFTVDREKYRLANDPIILNQAAQVVMPLTKDGIDSFYIRDAIRDPRADQTAYAERITKSDLAAFPIERQGVKNEEVPEVAREFGNLALVTPIKIEAKEIRRDDLYTKGIYKILNVPISDLNSAWQLKGEKKISAVITDQEFLQRIRDRTLTLGENDALEVELVQRFFGSRGKYEVVQVFHHLPGGKRVIDSK